MLTDIIPAGARKVVYAVYALAGVALGGLQVGYQVAETGQPTWLKVAVGVFAYVGVAIGATAASNTATGRHSADLDNLEE